MAVRMVMIIRPAVKTAEPAMQTAQQKKESRKTTTARPQKMILLKMQQKISRKVCRQQIKHIPYGIFSVRQFQQCLQDLQAVSERKSPMKNFKSIKSDFKTII